MEELSSKRARNHISLRVIWPEDKMVDITQFRFLAPDKDSSRNIRVAPVGITTSVGYWVYGDRVSFISSKKESFGFIVESAELADMLRQQFEVFWDISKELEKIDKGRNPHTGETIQIAATRTAKFRPAKALKDAVK